MSHHGRKIVLRVAAQILLLTSPPGQDLSREFELADNFVVDLLHHVQITLMVDFSETSCNLLNEVLSLLFKCVGFLV